MIKIKQKQNGEMDVILDGKSIEHMSFHNIKQWFGVAKPVIDEAQKSLNNYQSIINKLKTLRANVDNKNLSDAAFREFVKTLF